MPFAGSHRTRQTRPIPTTKSRLTPQSERVKARFIAGESIRKIAREEQISREKVTHIVRLEDVQAYIREMREMFFGLGHPALCAVRNALEEEKDARLAYQLLTDIGVVPSASERQIPVPQATAEDNENTRVQNIMSRLMRVAFERARVFGTPIGEAIERDLKMIGAKFDPTTGAISSVDDKPADS
jgi:hypothetical protein